MSPFTFRRTISVWMSTFHFTENSLQFVFTQILILSPNLENIKKIKKKDNSSLSLWWFYNRIIIYIKTITFWLFIFLICRVEYRMYNITDLFCTTFALSWPNNIANHSHKTHLTWKTPIILHEIKYSWNNHG